MRGSWTLIYEHFGENRSGKTLYMAILAWEAFLLGKIVYCNCPIRADGKTRECILNMPHEHLDPEDYHQKDLYNCFLMTDESAIPLDARASMSSPRKGISAFARQAKKRDVDWHYDTIRRADIETRIRHNPDFIIESIRVPRNIKLPLMAVRLRITNRVTGETKALILLQPNLFFPLYNDTVMVKSKEAS